MNLPLFAQSDPPSLPMRIPCISLWDPYASLVVAGTKTIETRTWPWPYEPGWLAIHCARHVDLEAVRQLKVRLDNAGIGTFVFGGHVIGLVYVTECRALLPGDEQAACFYAPDRYAWVLKWARRLSKPIAMRGPQKFVYLSRDLIEAAQ